MTETALAKPRIRVPARRGARMDAMPEVETSYHAASTGARDMATWNPYRSSPDAALLSELDTIVARSDDLSRNNGIASGAERTFVDSAIGPRTTLKPNLDRVALKMEKAKADEIAAEIESKWKGFADSVWFDAGQRQNFHGQTRLQAKMLSSCGEALALPLWLKDRGSKWNTCIQLIDPARLSNPNDAADSDTLRGGIEIDQYGAPVAYHIRKAHPGDVFGFSSFTRGTWERIPAHTPWGRMRVVHLYEPDRVGQSRGKPMIASVARNFKMLDHLMREKLRLAILDTMMFGSLETQLDQESMVEVLGGDKLTAFKSELNEWRVQMKGGQIVKPPIGTTLKSFTPERGPSELDAFTTIMLRHIATGLNLPYELVARDFSKTNYSSARASLLEAWRYFAACRQLFADGWASPMYELWFEEAVNRGEIPGCTPADFYANRIAWTQCKWIWAGRGWVDPLKEAQAAGERMANCLSTIEDESAEQGKDWRETVSQRVSEIALIKKECDAVGIDYLLVIPQIKSAASAAPATPADDDEADAPVQNDNRQPEEAVA